MITPQMRIAVSTVPKQLRYRPIISCELACSIPAWHQHKSHLESPLPDGYRKEEELTLGCVRRSILESNHKCPGWFKQKSVPSIFHDDRPSAPSCRCSPVIWDWGEEFDAVDRVVSEQYEGPSDHESSSLRRQWIVS